MRHVLTISIFATLFSGCGLFHTTKAVELPGGGVGYRMKCRTPGECEQRAVKVCPHGYSVVEGMGKPGKTEVVRCNGTDG